jgi:hypothetical protein
MRVAEGNKRDLYVLLHALKEIVFRYTTYDIRYMIYEL